MNLTKTLVIVVGIAALVALSYLGFGLYNNESSAQAEPSATIDLGDEKARLGYTIGVQIGRDLAQAKMGEHIDLSALSAALGQALAGQDLQMSDDEMFATQQAFQQQREQEYQALAANNASISAAYLEQNKAADGVTTTETGLQYQVLREGTGVTPGANDTVSVHYSGALVDGTVFDSSYERGTPVEFPVNGVIPGFSEGLMLMKEGAKNRFTIPADLAYGERAPETIGPNQALVFEVELLNIVSADQAEADSTVESE